MRLTERQVDLLGALIAFHKNMAGCEGWENQGAKPLDLGGRNGSHHSATLNQLVRKGYARRDRKVLKNGCRPGCYYWVTPAGVGALKDYAKGLS